jgi:hypothetical protein
VADGVFDKVFFAFVSKFFAVLISFLIFGDNVTVMVLL